MSRAAEIESRVEAVSRALWTGDDCERWIPELEALCRECVPHSAAWQFAHRQLALVLAPSNPWKASSVARTLLTGHPREHAAWAALGLAQSLLGQHRFAVRCYERALRIAPNQPRYAHNLGHLYDVVLDQPAAALALLERAHQAEPLCAEIASSFAHALGRTGQAHRGLDILRGCTRSGHTLAQREVLDWLESLVPSSGEASIEVSSDVSSDPLP